MSDDPLKVPAVQQDIYEAVMNPDGVCPTCYQKLHVEQAPTGQQAEPTTFRKWWTEKGQFTRPNLSTEPADFAFERAVAHAAWKAALAGRQANLPKEGEPKALGDVAAERERQKTVEGWTPKHDDLEHDDGALAIAAACYAIADRTALDTRTVRVTSLWEWTGWAPSGFKPRDRRSNLVRSGALILAEIERIDRAALAADKKGESNG